MNMFRHSLASLLPLAAAVAFCAPCAHAQTVSPVPAPTIITTAPYTISKPGYYQLGADLTLASSSNNAIITIAASNVTLDFAGHYISGPNNAATEINGVYSYEQGNLVIRNGTVAYCKVGIYLNSNNMSNTINFNQRVDNMLVTYCFGYGVFASSASNSQYTNCRVSFTGGSSNESVAYGLSFSNGAGNRCQDNVIISTGSTSTAKACGIYGTGTFDADHNSISTVTCSSTGTAVGILSPTFAKNNTVLNATTTGISGGALQNNIAQGCGTDFGGGYLNGGNNAGF